MFFKDLTRVEQLEERERLRDRLATLGEMAASMAHELKNPLAGIEVMAGLLRRKVADSPDAQSLVTDIINEAKLANATVVEVLDYVRPVAARDRTDIAHGRPARCGDDGGRQGAARRDCRWTCVVPERSAADPGRSPAAVPGVHQPGDQRVRGDERARARGDRRAHGRDRSRARRTTARRRAP